MSLKKSVFVDRIEVTEFNVVQVRKKTAILENNKQISESFHRHVVVPGDDYSNEDDKVKAICDAIHTPEVVEAYQAMMETNKPKVEV